MALGIKGDQCPPLVGSGIYIIKLDDGTKTGSFTATWHYEPDYVLLYDKELVSLQEVYDYHERTTYAEFIHQCRVVVSTQEGIPYERGEEIDNRLRAIRFQDGEASALKNKTDMTDAELVIY